MSKEQLLDKMINALVNGDKEAVKDTVSRIINANVDPETVIDEGLSKGMSLIGDKFENGEIFLADMIFASEAMEEGLSMLLPLISKEKAERKRSGTIVIGTVKGDIHDIGKNIVIAYLRTAGFDIHDMGVDVDPIAFIEKAEEVDADIIAMSSLLSTTRVYIQDAIKYLEDTGNREKFRIVVGGTAVTPEWAEEIHADGYASVAADAVKVCKELV